MSNGASRLDVARVRGLFPALADGYVHADGPAGSLVPEAVAHAVGTAMRMPVANRGGVFPASGRLLSPSSGFLESQAATVAVSSTSASARKMGMDLGDIV